MYYELYLDVLFLVNFMMDFLLLSLVRIITRCSTTHRRIVLGSIIGSLLTCLSFLLPIQNTVLRIVLFHVIINTIMIKLGLKTKTKRAFIKCFISLYIGGFLLGGIFEFLQQYFQAYLKLGSLYFALAIMSYFIVKAIWWFVCALQVHKNNHYDVEIFIDGRSCVVKALLDTGNSLRDSVTGKPINILEEEIAIQLLSNMPEHVIRYVSYHTLNGTGVIPLLVVERLHLIGDQELWIEDAYVAIKSGQISSGDEYKMILNPNIF